MTTTNPNFKHTISPTSDTSKANLADVWRAIDTPVYRVIDEDGVNVAGAQMRRLDPHTWLYVDDTDGYSLLLDEDMTSLFLVPDAKHIPYGWDRNGNVIRL